MTDYQTWSGVVIRRLKARGWKLLGEGIYSTVLGKGPYAIKVSNGNDDWEDYVIWATKAGFSGGFAPRVQCVHRYTHGLIALMERLDTTIQDCGREELNNAFRFIWRDRGVPLDDFYPGFSSFLEQAQSNGFGNDLHNGNVMLQHASGCIVVTDPSSRAKSTEARRWRAVGNVVITRDGQAL